MADKKERKRIVPQLIISPVKAPIEDGPSTVQQALADLGDLKQHSELAANLLGQGRKIHIDLAAQQREQKPVDWKELLKERGVRSGRRGPTSTPAAQPSADLAPSEGLFGGRTLAMNPLARIIQKLERSVAIANISADGEGDSSGSEEEEERRGTEVGAVISDSEGEGEGSEDEDLDAMDIDSSVWQDEESWRSHLEDLKRWMESRNWEEWPRISPTAEEATDKISGAEMGQDEQREDVLAKFLLAQKYGRRALLKGKTGDTLVGLTRERLEVLDKELPAGWWSSGREKSEGYKAKEGKEDAKNEVKAKGKREYGNEYDYHDDWIDDSEHIEQLEYTDRRKAKYEGFFIVKGSIDRSDELMPGAAPMKGGAKGKRKAADLAGGSAEGGGGGSAAAAGGGGGGGAQVQGADSSAQSDLKEKHGPKRKKLKTGAGEGVAVSEGGKKQLPAGQTSALSPGARAAAGKGEGSKGRSAAEAVPYEMPADVAHAIFELKRLARDAPLPQQTAAEASAGKAARKYLPPGILEALKNASEIFQRDCRKYKVSASRRILDELFGVLEPFANRENLRLYVVGRPQSHTKTATPAPSTIDTTELKDLLKAVPIAAPQHPTVMLSGGGGGSDEDFVNPAGSSATPSLASNYKNVPMDARKKIYEYMKLHLKGATLNRPEAQRVVAEVLALFPPGSIDADGVKKIYQTQRTNEQARAAAAGKAAPASASGDAVSTPQDPGASMPDQSTQPQPLLLPSSFTTPGVAAAAAIAPVVVPSTAPMNLAQIAAMAGQQAAQGVAATFNPPDGAAAADDVAPPEPQQALAHAVTPAPAHPPKDEPQAQSQQQEQQPSAVRRGRKSGPRSIKNEPLDEQLVSKIEAFGGDVSAFQELYSNCTAKYPRVLLHALAVAGPSGLSVAEVASEAVKLGIETWDAANKTVKDGLSRETKNYRHAVARLPKSKYALKLFPGVVDVREEGTAQGKQHSSSRRTTMNGSKLNVDATGGDGTPTIKAQSEVSAAAEQRGGKVDQGTRDASAGGGGAAAGEDGDQG